ncbi:MAG: inositol monophosphatase family protein, partial [Myxococcota bacterium]
AEDGIRDGIVRLVGSEMCISDRDICAAAVLVTEAGGRLTSIAGEDTIAGGSALATNGQLHDALVALLAPG